MEKRKNNKNAIPFTEFEYHLNQSILIELYSRQLMFHGFWSGLIENRH